MGRQALFVLMVFSVLFLSFAAKASADGMMHVSDPDMYPGWMLQPESRQLAAINYENGRENLILAVDADLAGKQAVWIFPVPASPEETNVDIIKGFPRLVGSDIRSAARSSVSAGFLLMTLSQIYTAPVMIFSLFAGTGFQAGDLADSYRGAEGIEVYEHVESMGLVTELVTAQDGNSLDGYLSQKGLQLPNESKAVLEEYVGRKYSFAVSWISDVEKFKNESQSDDAYVSGTRPNTMGVYVSFPSERIYFPLKPTSVYGNERIPLAVYVMGHVTPDLYQGISDSRTEYFMQNYYAVPGELSQFFNGKSQMQGLKYTKISIDEPSSAFTDDLWISDSPAAISPLVTFVVDYFWIWSLGIFLIASVCASVLSGMIIFRKEKPSLKHFILIGLANLLTLIGLVAAARTLDKKYPKTQNEKISARTKKILIAGGAVVFVMLVLFFIILLGGIFGSCYGCGAMEYAFRIITVLLGILMLLILAAIPLAIPGVFIYTLDKNKATKEFVILFSAIFMAFVLAFLWLFSSLVG
jgi:hypothetical protein